MKDISETGLSNTDHSTSTKHSTIYDLPLDKIIGFLDTRNWLQFSYTCQSINQFKYERELMFDKLRTCKKGVSPEFLYNRFQLSYGSLFAVDLTNVQLLPIGVTRFLSSAHTVHLACDLLKRYESNYLQGVKSLKLQGVRVESFEYFQNSITCLHLHSCESVSDDVFKYLTAVRELSLKQCPLLSDQLFLHLEASLRVLDISGCKQFTDRAFTSFKHVEELRMSGCNQETISDNAFSYLTEIQKLDMSFCNQLTISDKAFSYLRKSDHSKGIEYLNMAHCNQHTITDQAFSHLKSSIKIIVSNGCDQITITERAFRSLKYAPKLQRWEALEMHPELPRIILSYFSPRIKVVLYADNDSLPLSQA